MVTSIVIHKNTISISPPVKDCNPKNITDHNTFKKSCMPKIEIAILTSILQMPLRHTRKRAIPINIKRVVQTGPNSQLGGAHAGFAKIVYHVGMDDMVATEPIKPAINGINRDIINFKISDFLRVSINYTP